MRYNTIITEEPPTPCGSIFCKVKTESASGRVTFGHGGSDYFVCNLKREVTQYFQWMVSDRVFRRALKKQGYTLKLR